MPEVMQPIRPRHRTGSLIVLTLDVLVILILLVCTTMAAPRFRQIFEDMQVWRNLSALAQLILSTPRAVYVLSLATAIAMLIWKESRIASRTQTLAINLGALVVAVLLLAGVVHAMFAPMCALVTSQTGLQPDEASTNATPVTEGHP